MRPRSNLNAAWHALMHYDDVGDNDDGDDAPGGSYLCGSGFCISLLHVPVPEYQHVYKVDARLACAQHSF